MIVNATDWRRPTAASDAVIKQSVRDILDDIAQDTGKIADYSMQFDNFTPEFIELKPFEAYQLDEQLAHSIKQAAERIETFARFQKQGFETKSYSDNYGQYQQIVTPIERAGCYIPGGRFPLISTALMTLIPAKVAGCKHRVAVSPSDHPALLAAASLAGATQFLKVGGVQAIGALAFGFSTESSNVESVDIIVGPGNAYVNEAKAQVQSK
ncbi:MAG: histidinol dehydrogenase, partial [Kangiellaceae bacterium]|nr:histidinol dehydrogenase [Kangiellaceae bacterium]